MRKTISIGLVLALVGMAFALVPLCASSEEPEGPQGPELPDPPELPEGPPRPGEGEWWVEGEGTDFELTNSPYLNVALSSSENIRVYLESLPRIVSLNIEAVDSATSTEITYSGFEPSTTYYRYQESYLQEAFTTDDTGSFTFTQDITTPHHVFIQDAEATIYIYSDGTVTPGAPIQVVGTTYTLTANVYESIYIQKSGITFDGGGHTITADYYYGIYSPSLSDITITNAIISNSNIGIYLYSSDNTIISYNTITNTLNGIFMNSYYSSGSNTITENTILSSSYRGIYVYSYHPSGSNTVSGNEISDCGIHGIYLYTYSSSGSDTISGNEVSYCNDGIYVYSSGSSTLTGNMVSNCANIGIYLYSSSSSGSTLRDNTMAANTYNFGVAGDYSNPDIDTSNTVDGKPIYYWIGYSSETVPPGAGYVALINCDQITVEYSTLTNNYHGVLLYSTTNSIIRNVDISNNYYSIYLYNSGSSTITGCTISNIVNYGIYQYNSGSSTITWNTISNNYYGIYQYNSGSSTISENTVSNSVFSGIALSNSGTSTISENTVSNSGYGIQLAGSSSSTISGNTVSNSDYGIYLSPNNDDITLQDNTLDGNQNYGIYISYCTNCYLRNNDMTNNVYNFVIWGDPTSATNYIHDIDTSNLVDGKPIYYLVGATGVTIDQFTNAGFVGLVNSDHITVENLMLANNGFGVLMVGTSFSTIQNVDISNVMYGFGIFNSDSNAIDIITLSGSVYYGINIFGSNLNTITGSTFTGVQTGIFMYGFTSGSISYTCSDNTIDGNTITASVNGIFLSLSGGDHINNVISGNTISQHNNYGIYAPNQRGSTLSGNTISGGKNGIYETGYLNTISGNTISDCSNIGLQISSTGSTIIGNTVSGSNGGISIYSAKGCTLKNNIIENNNYNFGIHTYYSLDYLYHDIDTSNTINGNPIYYYLNRSLESVPRDAGYVGIVNSIGITVDSMTLQNNVQGMLLAFSPDCTIENMNFLNNIRGIEGISASGASISGCTFSGSNDGIYIRYYGSPNSDLIISGNTFLDIYYYAIYIYGISSSTISGNTISTAYHGMNLYNCQSTTISGNTLSSVVSEGYGRGMYIYGNDNSITGNTVSGYFLYGLMLYNFNNGVISGNTISGNNYGLYIYYSNGNTIFHNNIIDNTNQLLHSGTNTWDNGEGEGNYWSDYLGEDLDNDGVGDTLLPHQGVDNYPLMSPWSPSPSKAIEKLIIYIQGLGLPHGIENSLISQLNAAMNALSNNQNHTAVNILNAFINHVEALRGNKLTDEQADYLVASAMHIILLIESQ
jgi:parallel beta-helix repeat protein